MKALKFVVDPFLRLEAGFREMEELISIVDDNDTRSIEHLMGEAAKWRKTLEDLEFKSMMSGKFDQNNAIISINAGAGGTESCDWAGMLLRMYAKWAEPRGYEFERLDYLSG